MNIVFDQDSRIFMLHTRNTTYAMSVEDKGLLCHRYWGERIDLCSDLTAIETMRNRTIANKNNAEWFQEYPGWGGHFENQHALKVTYADGTRNALLRYRDYQIKDNTLLITLADPDFNLLVELNYTLIPELDIINRSSKIINAGQTAVKLENAFSATWRLQPRTHYRLTHLCGAWGKEYSIRRMEIQDGAFVLESRTGMSGPEHVPLFVIDEGQTTELAGQLYYGTLQWSGNFRIIVEKDAYENVSVTGGINDLDFEWPLKPGESFETPVFTAGWTCEGFSGMSRKLHRYQRQYLMRQVDNERELPVIVNAYGCFRGNINEEKIMRIIDRVQEVGAEALLIDAGWSGVGDNYPSGMGDWNINPDRFPNQLKNIADALHAKGLQFGLWVEPEMASSESQLVKEHPEWVLRYPARDPYCFHMNRVVLNFALDEVWQNILQKVIHIIETCHVDYYKMDYNRKIIEYGCSLLPPEEQKTIGVRYVRNLYKFYEALVERFPDLLIENCAGGGQRVDLAMTRFSGRINRSDNQDPLDILKLHEGFTYLMLSKFAGGGCHISKDFTPNTNRRQSPRRFQAQVAMMGSLAIGENLPALTDDEIAEIAGYVAQHKKLRHITQQGEIYRLASAWEKDYAAFEYVLEDQSEAVLMVYGQSIQLNTCSHENIRLAGLDPDARYEVDGYGLRSGRGLMHAGLQVNLYGDMDSQVIYLKKIV